MGVRGRREQPGSEQGLCLSGKDAGLNVSAEYLVAGGERCSRGRPAFSLSPEMNIAATTGPHSGRREEDGQARAKYACTPHQAAPMNEHFHADNPIIRAAQTLPHELYGK